MRKQSSMRSVACCAEDYLCCRIAFLSIKAILVSEKFGESGDFYLAFTVMSSATVVGVEIRKKHSKSSH